MRLAAVLVVLCMLFGCASAPKIDYYTLGMESSGRAVPSDNLSVERFRTTEALGRSQIMVLMSATRIEYYATDQWAGSLGELVQQKLASEFGAPAEGRRTFAISGTVLSCEQVDTPDGAEARVRLEIAVRDAEKPRYQSPLLEKTYACSRPVGGANPGSLVQQLSRCIEDIATEIAADVSENR